LCSGWWDALAPINTCSSTGSHIACTGAPHTAHRSTHCAPMLPLHMHLPRPTVPLPFTAAIHRCRSPLPFTPLPFAHCHSPLPPTTAQLPRGVHVLVGRAAGRRGRAPLRLGSPARPPAELRAAANGEACKDKAADARARTRTPLAARPLAHSPTRPLAHSPTRPLACSPTRPLTHSPLDTR
jgi:hypothetical protein